MAPDGGHCDLPAVTYVGHRTLITGTFPITHGLTSNLAAAPVPGTCPGWAGEAVVRTPTLFAAMRESGLRAAAVCGDQNLVNIIGAIRADYVWPAGGVLAETTPVCPSGYAVNAAVREPLLAAIEDRDLCFVFGHLNETDTWGHRHGPDHPDTRRAYRATDAIVGEVAERLKPEWDRVLLIVLSDHGMEEVQGSRPVDLLATLAVRATVDDVVAEGGSALAHVRAGVSVIAAGAALSTIPGVSGWRELRPGVLLVAGESGVRFASGPAKSVLGVHGGPGSTTTLALVTGGHPSVRCLAAVIGERAPHLADWAPTIAALFGIPFPIAEGRDLLAG
jgi:arylsulfatase A-like enzyme